MTRAALTDLVLPLREGRRGAVAGSVLLTLSTIAVDLARPWPLAFTVDRLLAVQRPAHAPLLLAGAAAATALLVVLSTVLDAWSRLVAETTAERLGSDLRTAVFARATSLGLAWHDGTGSGELVSRLTTDVSRVLDGVVSATAVLVPETLALVGVTVVMVVIDPVLALVALATVPVLWLLAIRQRRLVREAQQRARSRSGRLAATATDLLRNVAAVHAFGRQDRAGALFAERDDAYVESEVAALRVQARWAPRAESVLALGSALVLLVGGWQVMAGRQSVGELLVVLAYSRDLYTPVRSLARLSGSLAKAGASADRIQDVLGALEVVEDRPGAVALEARAHTIEFEDVTLRYGDRPALRGLDLRVAEGETVCLVGSSGAGKSSALSLLLRLRDPDAGRVLVDGTDVRDLRLHSLRAHVAFVPQDGWLFDASLADNIGWGAARPTRTAVVRAGRLADLDDVVRRLPQGWDTPLGEGGGRLSGGQRRRVALARAIVSGAPVLLMDEPTASLDAGTAQRVVAAIARAAEHRTTLIATHDPAVMAIADRVVDLDAVTGRVPAWY